MILLNGKPLDIGHFPDGTMLLKCENESLMPKLTWLYEDDRELVYVMYLAKHLRKNGAMDIFLDMPFCPNARQDRVKRNSDIFTLKYFADFINSLDFASVTIFDPHSDVSPALINNVIVKSPDEKIREAINKIDSDTLITFFPDYGAVKRYSDMATDIYAYGIKRRNWETGQIEGLDVAGAVDQIAGKGILIVDDICSRGGTFYHSAKKLKELGAKDIYLYVSHCENTILEGELLKGDLIKKVFTTKSIFTKQHEKIEVI